MDPRTPNESPARAVVTAYRAGERMPPSRRDAAWERLAAAIAEEEVATPGRGRPRWLAAGAVLLAAAAVVLVVDGLRRSADRQASEAGDHQAVHDAPEVAPEPVRMVRPPAGKAAVVAPPVPVDREPTTREPAQRPTATAPDAALGAELALLRAARAALANGSPEQALRELAEHQRRFPGGLLAQERMVLRVQALCDSGSTGQARAAAREFTQAYPSSPHVASCGE